MHLIEIAKKELIRIGFKPDDAEYFSKEVVTGFALLVAEKYAQQKFKEGAAAQKVICSNTPVISKYNNGNALELVRVIKHEIENAPDPVYK